MTSLSTKLAKREAAGRPVQVGLIGAGKFGSMFISQSHRTAGLRLAGIADLDKDRALAALTRTGYPEDGYDASASISLEDGLKAGKTAITTDSAQLIATPGIDVILEVTGSPAAGIRHALLVCRPILDRSTVQMLMYCSAVNTRSTSSWSTLRLMC